MKRRRQQGTGARGDPLEAASGLERLLRLAAENEAFRRELIRKRSSVALPPGTSLTAIEAAIVDAAPAELLWDSAQGLAAQQLPRREFLHRAAAASAAALSGGLVAQATMGCCPPEEQAEPHRGSRQSAELRGPYVMPHGGAIAEPVDELSGPKVMPEGGTGRRYRIRGPRVMPDPHVARQAAEEASLDSIEALLGDEDAAGGGRDGG